MSVVPAFHICMILQYRPYSKADEFLQFKRKALEQSFSNSNVHMYHLGIRLQTQSSESLRFLTSPCRAGALQLVHGPPHVSHLWDLQCSSSYGEVEN